MQRDPFERGLRALGWTPWSTIITQHRYAEGEADRLPETWAELVRLKVDVIAVLAVRPPALLGGPPARFPSSCRPSPTRFDGAAHTVP